MENLRESIMLLTLGICCKTAAAQTPEDVVERIQAAQILFDLTNDECNHIMAETNAFVKALASGALNTEASKALLASHAGTMQ